MKRFRNIILALFLVLVITTTINLVYVILGLFFNIGIISYQENISINTKLIFIIKAVALLIFIFSVFILIKNLKFIVQRDFFNPLLIQNFRRSGKLFLISGIIGFITSILSIVNVMFFNQMYINIDSRSLYIMLMILGVFFLLFSKVLSKGNEIQQENDLTI